MGLGFLVAAIPTACLAAILFKVGIEILDYRILPVLRKIPLTDLVIFVPLSVLVFTFDVVVCAWNFLTLSKVVDLFIFFKFLCINSSLASLGWS